MEPYRNIKLWQSSTKSPKRESVIVEAAGEIKKHLLPRFLHTGERVVPWLRGYIRETVGGAGYSVVSNRLRLLA